MRRWGVLLAAACGSLLACPHDFTRKMPGDVGADRGATDSAVFDLPRDARVPDRGARPDLPSPDAPPCPAPCVQSLSFFFDGPTSVAVDSKGDIYVAEYNKNRIRVVSGGKVSTLAGGAQGYKDGDIATAEFSSPHGVAVDGAGAVYVADSGNHRIRVITGNQVVTLAGDGVWAFKDGPAAAARFDRPAAVAVDGAGTVYVADEFNHRIRRIANDVVDTLAGSGYPGLKNGSAAMAEFYCPRGVAVDGAGVVYVADSWTHTVRVVAGGMVSTLSGGIPGFADGAVNVASFNEPSGLVLDAAGRLLVVDQDNNAIRLIDGKSVTTLAGDGYGGLKEGWGPAARFSYPRGVAVDPASGWVYVADTNNNRLRVIKP